MNIDSTGVTSGTHSPRHLARFARQWGYRCDLSSLAGDALSHDADLPVAEGVLSAMELPCGVRFCAQNLVVSRDNERAAIISQSLTIILTLSGQPTRYRLGSTDHILRPEAAVVIAAADSARLSGGYRKGDYSRSLVLHASPDNIGDDDLAERLYRRLSKTEIKPLPASSRVRALAGELFTACHTGPIARILAESCALELLARGLVDDTSRNAVSSTSICARDVVSIQRVRDKLLSNLKEDHSLCDLARLAGMSVTSLKEKFSSVVGQSVFEFLRDQRLERARRGLKNEGWTVKQAAYAVGYAHPSNFSTAYRKRFGIAPGQARAG